MARPVLKVLLLTAIALTTHRISFGKEWRGLRPYHSTREQALTLLGACTDEDNDRCYYDLPEDEVVISFNSSCYNVPKNTITSIEVMPKKPVPLDQYRLDLKKMTVLKNRMMEPDYLCYFDERAGIIFHTIEARIERISYLPNARDRKLCKEETLAELCPSVFTRAHQATRCPEVKLIGPSYEVDAGSTVDLHVELSNVPKTSKLGERGIIREPLVYDWRSTYGTIVQGQGTNEIKLDTTGSRYPFIEVKVAIQNLAPECGATLSLIIELRKWD